MSIFTLGLDAVDGSPVLDIKPVFREFYPSFTDIKQPNWVGELMKDYFSAAKDPSSVDHKT